MLSPPPYDLLSGASLFLDLDGTLVEIASRPDGVLVDEGLHQLLSGLSRRLGGRLAIISGRPTEEIRSFFPDLHLAIAGSHGIEIRWPDGRITRPVATNPGLPVLQRIREFENAHPDVFVERKPFGIAFHYRLAPGAERACHLFAGEIARTAGYALQTGKKVVELKLIDVDKGDALSTLMGKPPMQGTKPVFIGDDDTDEAGFRMAKRLGGAGVLVGPARASDAVFGLEGVDETLQWLAAAGERVA